ncbi:MAG TPA: HIT family protein [Fermentimonas caenicola]|jgi:histidine triad (HIT) family protein|uniref:Histidine triad (HIT) protein n=1 Tax=Fermentimonas caenicola TaxID=1562970 RepID=A0A098C0F1_9BACT|nr:MULTISPECIES: HIT family protein [Lascolabacillus]MBP6174765.1 HIT family protein [Fermentimonas sp.]MDI9625514.1 HIT family protein [Bacteroidota bacterium]TAH60367.1 MAG: HIT family protein [Fermentimonas caenicola]MBP6196345.1 HIT family protein [Fermentimonas sp.]MBP7105459.1 HIT family protein [Fermentimonas sp.]
MATIFSRIIAGEIPSYKIAENDKFFAFLDVSPRVKGHTLVVPKKEIDYIFDIEDELLAEMMVFAKRIAKAIETAIPCKRIGVMVLGLEVPHAHIHLLPIQSEKDMNLSNPKLKLEAEEFTEITRKIKEAFI